MPKKTPVETKSHDHAGETGDENLQQTQFAFMASEKKKWYDENKINKNLIMLTDPHSYEAEQFRDLRTRILFPPSGSAPPHILMVTSALPNEGKSFVSVNLAICIAHILENSVLLVDCDIRNPTIHRYLGFDDINGLSEYLTEDIPLTLPIYETVVRQLTILPGGTPPMNPSELISSVKMSDLLVKLKNEFQDHIIILDSPPPKVTAETNVIVRHVDGVVFVVRYGKTSKDMTYELIERIGREKICGIVVNQYKSAVQRFDSRKYYKNYYFNKKRKR